ncbi:MAG: pantoate--beta-alanine ligase [Marinirhabdus sp.]|nr:pantoate--beta-alanine ligase [Marinirhabdus sp.]
MKVFTTKKELQEKLYAMPIETSIGFVPTMGALHHGHISLVKTALIENDHVVVSIFVNPTQFDNTGDLVNYPRTLNDDVALLEGLSSNITVFAPTPEEVYGTNVASKRYDFGGIENEMEGKHRKGHFDGVGTVLTHLFRIIEPSKAYFGEKDFQQLQIARKLVLIENMPVQVVGCPILRESNGLAMSSRNKRLTPEQREHATIIYEVLEQTRKNFHQDSIPELTKAAKEAFEGNQYVQLEYFDIADVDTLTTAHSKEEGQKYRAFVAAFVGEVRLIDNVALN